MRFFFALLLLFCFGLPPAWAQGPVFQFLGASSAPLYDPHDLKLSPDGRALFVSDVGNDRIVLLNPQTLAPVATFGAGELSGPHDIDFDAAGRVLVADTQNNRVAVFALEGITWRLVDAISERIRGPEGVLAHPNGRIYVAGAWSDNVVAFEENRVVAELGGLSAPHDLEVAPDGRIWLADAGNDRLLLLSQDLEILETREGPPYRFDGVRYLDVLEDGTVLAADKYSHQVKVIGPDKELLRVLGSGRAEKGPNRFTTPEGVETRGDRVWISDSGNDRVVVYRMRR